MMKIGEKLLKRLSQKYSPEKLIHQKFERYDISFKTDHEGTPVLLFIGTRNENGQIRGERFVRVVVRAADGSILKDHWDNKGKI